MSGNRQQLSSEKIRTAVKIRQRGAEATLGQAQTCMWSDVPDVLDGAGDDQALHLPAELNVGVVLMGTDESEAPGVPVAHGSEPAEQRFLDVGHDDDNELAGED